MLSALAATMFLLTFFVLPGPISRLLGAKFVTMFLATTGVFVIPVMLGPNWRAALLAGFDVALLLAGAKLATRFGFAQKMCAVWVKRIAAAVCASFFAAFAVLALMVASLDGRAIDALPYDFLALISGIAFAMLPSRRRERVPARQFAGSLVSAPSLA